MFLKIWKKPVGTLYMIIVMYLNIYVYPSPTTVIITWNLTFETILLHLV